MFTKIIPLMDKRRLQSHWNRATARRRITCGILLFCPTVALHSRLWQSYLRTSTSLLSIPKNTDNAAAIAAERIETWFNETKPERRDAALLSGKSVVDEWSITPVGPHWASKEEAWDAVTYGEFDLGLFERALTRIEMLLAKKRNRAIIGGTKKFVDIGSGCGRLVLAAALLRPRWAICEETGARNGKFTGIEILSSLHGRAVLAHRRALEDNHIDTADAAVLQCCHFLHVDMCSDEAKDVLLEADAIFSYSTAFPTDDYDGITVALLSRALLGVRQGCIVATVDNWLGDVLMEKPTIGSAGLVCRFELLEELKGYNQDFDDCSSVFLWDVSYGPPTADELQRVAYNPETGEIPLIDGVQ